jgi:hypothetical protein
LIALLLGGCQSQRTYEDGYDDGYDDGYAQGVTNGQDVGYRQGLDEGYSRGYATARPAGAELSGRAAFLVRVGALMGGLLFALGLLACAWRLAFATGDRNARIGKGASAAVSIVLASIMTTLLGINRSFDFLLLLGRPESPYLLTVLVTSVAIAAFFATAFLASFIQVERSMRAQAYLAAVFAFLLTVVIAGEGALLGAPSPERYVFSYVAVGILVGCSAFGAHRLLRKAEGW